MGHKENYANKNMGKWFFRLVTAFLLVMLLCYGAAPVTAYASSLPTTIDTVEFGNSRYVGEFRGKHPCGQGEFYYMEGSGVQVLSGEWSFGDAQMYHTFGMLEGETCAEYRGMFLNNVACGYGALVFEDGNMYYGVFVDGVPHGEGVYQYADGTEVTGFFDWEVREAYYMHPTRAGGEVYYTGMVRSGDPCGFGTLEFEEGGTFYGEFYDGNVEGAGMYVYSTPSGGQYTTFSGEKWTMVFGQTSVNFPGYTYYGLVHNGSWQGYGMGIMSNNSHYVGEVWYNLRSGYGREFNAENKLYRAGMYSNGNFVK